MFSCPVNIKIKLMGYALRNDLKPEKAITNILDDFFKNGDKK